MPRLPSSSCLKARTDLVHPRARVADHRDLELGCSDPDPLPDRPGVDVVALDREVLADAAVLDPDCIQVLGRREQDLPLRSGSRMRAALETMLLDRLNAVACIHPAAALGRRRPQTGNTRHR